MRIYLDSSSLFRLYHQEEGSEELKHLLINNRLQESTWAISVSLNLSQLLRKKVRTKELESVIAGQLVEIFRADYGRFYWIEHSFQTETFALDCLNLYGKEGLWTLDSIHLASARIVSSETNQFLTEDKVLKKLFGKEGLNTALYGWTLWTGFRNWFIMKKRWTGKSWGGINSWS